MNIQMDLFKQVTDVDLNYYHKLCEQCGLTNSLIAVSASTDRIVCKIDEELWLLDITKEPTRLSDYESILGCLIEKRKMKHHELKDKDWILA